MGRLIFSNSRDFAYQALRNAESTLANRHCIAALAWAERVKRHHVRVTIVNVTNFKIVQVQLI